MLVAENGAIPGENMETFTVKQTGHTGTNYSFAWSVLQEYSGSFLKSFSNSSTRSARARLQCMANFSARFPFSTSEPTLHRVSGLRSEKPDLRRREELWGRECPVAFDVSSGLNSSPGQSFQPDQRFKEWNIYPGQTGFEFLCNHNEISPLAEEATILRSRCDLNSGKK